MRDNRTGVVIGILIVLVLILGGLVTYSFVAKPAISGYAVKSQTQGYEFAILNIAQAAAQCQQVPLRVGNQTINLIAVECLQQAQQSQTESQPAQ